MNSRRNRLTPLAALLTACAVLATALLMLSPVEAQTSVEDQIAEVEQQISDQEAEVTRVEGLKADAEADLASAETALTTAKTAVTTAYTSAVQALETAYNDARQAFHDCSHANIHDTSLCDTQRQAMDDARDARSNSQAYQDWVDAKDAVGPAQAAFWDAHALVTKKEALLDAAQRRLADLKAKKARLEEMETSSGNPLSLPAPSDRQWTKGQRASYTFPGATGGTTPYSYSLVGSIPGGMSWDSGSKRLSGTPQNAGTWSITYVVFDSSSPPQSDAQGWTVRVRNPDTPPPVTTPDNPVPVTVNFDRAAYNVDEGRSVTVTVTLSPDPERTVTIPITATNQGGASAGDYSGVPADVTFNSGQTSRSFTFSATQDTVDDDNESVLLAFDNLPTAVSAGSRNETTVSITDDDGPPPPAVTVRFGQASYSVDEGATVTVTVTLSPDPERTVTIPITTTNQGGATGNDYSGVPPSVTFNSGDTSVSFDMTATQDAANDDGESVLLRFGNLPARVSAGTPRETTVTIEDDDTPVVEPVPTPG